LVGTDIGIVGLRVLVVDDTATNRQLLQVFLKKLGCEVMLAENGIDAIAVFEAEDPDLILMDVMMPGMDGYEATRRIKALAGDRWVPIVFVSALDKDENLVTGLEAGGDDYLPKPVNFVVLQAKLRSLVRTLQFQRRLDETRRFNAAVTDNIADCVVTIDDRGRILSTTAMSAVIFGYSPEELLGQNVSVLMPEPYRSAHDDYLRRYVMGGMPKVVGLPQRVVKGMRRDGTIFPLELTVTEMRFEGSRLFVGIVRDVSERVAAEAIEQAHAAALQRYHDDREVENALASAIMQRLLLRRGLSDPRLHHWLLAATEFSGDVIAAARSSDGRLCVMVADATGHGLGAAISVLPGLTSFYGMVEHAYPLGFIAYELNRLLLELMPTGRFVAASLVCFDEKKQAAEFWLGGMPDLLQLSADGAVLHRVRSSHPPLGIVEFDESMAGVQKLDCPPGTQLVLVSDGLLEAAAPGGETFGTERLTRALAGAAPTNRLQAAKDSLSRHLGELAPHDDVSILMLDC
jgi:two-component system, HptB-dependent secretion and biofilm response regulator